MRDMCAFFSVASVLEAMLRINGHNVKQLSWRHLYLDYIEEMQKPNACKESKVIILAKILKEKGMVELLSDGVPLVPEVRHKISDFKKFKMNTEDGVEAAIDHIHQHGPIVCVHVVTMYQRENKKSTGIIHGLANWKYHSGFEEDEDTLPSSQLPTHAVCAIGIGAEDLTPYLPYQNSAGEDVQNDGFGRILPSSVVEATGFIIDKGHERPSKRAKQTSQAGNRALSKQRDLAADWFQNLWTETNSLSCLLSRKSKDGFMRSIPCAILITIGTSNTLLQQHCPHDLRMVLQVGAARTYGHMVIEKRKYSISIAQGGCGSVTWWGGTYKQERRGGRDL